MAMDKIEQKLGEWGEQGQELLQLDDLLNIRSPEKIANLFQKLGYNAAIQPLNIDDLHLPARSTEAIDDLNELSGYKQ